MKKSIIITVFFAIMLFTSSTFAAGSITVTSEYLTNENGYNYGANFFVNSSVNGRIYVTANITSQSNVIGDVILGTLQLQPNEKHVKIGSFIQRDNSKGWNVNVNARWEPAD